VIPFLWFGCSCKLVKIILARNSDVTSIAQYQAPTCHRGHSFTAFLDLYFIFLTRSLLFKSNFHTFTHLSQAHEQGTSLVWEADLEYLIYGDSLKVQ